MYDFTFSIQFTKYFKGVKKFKAFVEIKKINVVSSRFSVSKTQTKINVKKA